jgi:hypothetical protein
VRPSTYYYIGDPVEGILAFEGTEQDGMVTEFMQSNIPNPNEVKLLDPIKDTLGKRVFATLKEAKTAYVKQLKTVLPKCETQLAEMPETDPNYPELVILIANLQYLQHISAARCIPVHDVATVRFQYLKRQKPKAPPLKPTTRAEYAKRAEGSKTRWRIELEGTRIYFTALDDVIVSASGEAESIVGHRLVRKLRFYERKGAKVSQVA